MQTAPNLSRALVDNEAAMGSMWSLNPEFDYIFLGDAEAADFVRRFCTPSERIAFHSALAGASKADLFRYFFLRALGGVYADVDVELRAPLREMIPAGASHVATEGWEMDFLAYEPAHPLLGAVAAYTSEYVNQQTEWARCGSPQRCEGSHACVIRTTGPVAYRNAVIQFTRSHGCLPANWVPAAGACDGSPLEALRRVHVCKDVRDGAGAAQWYCGVARHWDCRNSPRRRACGAAHYSERKEFFDRCMNHSVDAPCAAPPVEPAEHSDRRRGRLSGRVGDSRTLQPRSR